MTEDDLEWSKERVREKLLAERLGTEAPWDGEDITRMTRLWTYDNEIGAKIIKMEYYDLCNQIKKELFDGRGH